MLTSEILAYAELTGYTEQFFREQLCFYLPELDRVLLADFYDKQQKAFEEQQRKAEQERRKSDISARPRPRR